ncbi:MAG: hypothetical protein CMH49_10415 [Myxococcales bacterium]|nr:hypothetical protein [Myxococcales bacterium]
MTNTPPMIYVPQPQLPITYIQLCFSIHHSDLLSLSNSDSAPQSSALRILTQRQLQRGTQRIDRANFIRQIENLGTELQLTHRGYAHSVGAITLTRTLPQLSDLLQQAIIEPAFNSDEIEQSKRAYISELEARYDDDQSLAWLWLSRRLHLNHVLWGDYSIEAKHIEAIKVEEMQQAWPKLFNRTRFLPSFTSDLAKDKLSAMIEPLYDDLSWGEVKSTSSSSLFQPCTLASLDPLSKTNLTLVHKGGKQQALIFIAHPTIALDHPQALALFVALCALGGTFSAPLMHEIRTKRGLSYGAHAGIKGEGHCRFVCVYCTPEAPQVSEALMVMLQVYQRGGRGELSDNEIQFAKDYLINAHPFSMETPAMRAGMLANSSLMGIDPNLFFTQAERIKKLSPQEIRQSAQEHLSAQKLEILVYGDQEQIGDTLLNELQSSIAVDQVIRVKAKDGPEHIRV